MYRNNFEGACGDRERRQRSFLNVMHSPFYSLSFGPPSSLSLSPTQQNVQKIHPGDGGDLSPRNRNKVTHADLGRQPEQGNEGVTRRAPLVVGTGNGAESTGW